MLIVQKALELTQSSQIITIGEDTDLLIMLCHHFSLEAHNVFFMSETKCEGEQPARTWDIKKSSLIWAMVCVGICY